MTNLDRQSKWEGKHLGRQSRGVVHYPDRQMIKHSQPKGVGLNPDRQSYTVIILAGCVNCRFIKVILEGQDKTLTVNVEGKLRPPI